MSYKDKYTALQNAYGSSLGDAFKNSSINKLNSSFADTPFYRQIDIDGTLTDVRLVQDDITSQKKTLLFKPNTTINVGSVATINGQKWMVMDYFDNEIYPKANIQLCNSSLKWLDENGQVKEAWFAYKNETTRSLGLQEGNIMLLPVEQRFIFVQDNADTAKIEKGKRFIFDNRSWKLMSIDRLFSGLIYFHLEEQDINTAVDNVDLRIADYAGNIPNYSLKILNGDALSIRAGQSFQLNVEVKNHEQVVSKPLIYTSSNTNIATVSSTGLVTTIANGNATITVKLVDDNTISDTLSVTVEFVNSTNYSVNVIGDDFIYCGTSKTYNEQVKNNGIVDNTRFVQWYLYADDGISATTLATMTFSSTTQCTLTANNKSQKGFVKLKAVVIGSSTIVDIKRIEIKTLI